tara:strand:- start:158 stop:439 length:282 start_codon:yes stop_codon:yes gene_type:complete
MIKSELICLMADKNPHLTRSDLERVVNVIFEEISDTLSSGGRVELRGFGSFAIKRRPARIGRNPRTGAVVPVPEKNVLYFKTGKDLRERLNQK